MDLSPGESRRAAGGDRRWPAALLLWAVLLLAAVLRLWGIQHSLPYSYYGDEAHFVNRAVAFGSGDLNPHWFHKPAFFMYVLFGEYGLYYLAGLAAGQWSQVEDFAVGYLLDPGPFYLIGRLTTVGFSLATVWGVYRIGARHLARSVGILAALLLALSYGHVEASRVVKADIPAACFAVWSVYFLLNYTQDRRARSMALAAIMAGIGAATKYYTLILPLPLAAAIVLAPPRPPGSRGEMVRSCAGRLLLMAACFWGSYFVCAPYNFLDPLGRATTFGKFPARLAERFWEVAAGTPSEQPQDFYLQRMTIRAGLVDYLRVLASPQSLGAGIASLALVGLGLLLVQRRWGPVLMVLFAIGFALASVVSAPGYAEPRHQTPLMPFLAVAGALAVVRLSEWRAVTRPLVYAGLVCLLVLPLRAIVGQARELSREETRNLAKQWIESRLPAGTRLLVSENGPPLLASADALQPALDRAAQADPRGQFTAHYGRWLHYQRLAAERHVAYDLLEIRIPWWRPGFDQTGSHTLDTAWDRDMGNPLRPVGVERLDDYVQRGYQYAIVHSDQYGDFFAANRVAGNFPEYARFFRDLFAHAALVQEFDPIRDGARGPVVRVYRLQPASSPTAAAGPATAITGTAGKARARAPAPGTARPAPADIAR